MYATVTRRTPNRDRQAETLRQAESDFFPTLQQAPGFRGFYLIVGEDGENLALSLWEDRASATAFQDTQKAWGATLEEMGHRQGFSTAGAVLRHLSPQ